MEGKKMKNYDKIIIYLIMVATFSLFLEMKIYIPLFLLITLMCLPYFKQVNRWQIYLLFFLLYGGLLNVFYFNNFEINLYIKFIVNLAFLLVVPNFIEKVKIDSKFNNRFKLCLELIIILSFIQIIYVYMSQNLSLSYFLNIQNSIDAYAISRGTDPIFGHSNKNIWASKLFLVQLLYFNFILNDKIKIREFLMLSIFVINIMLLLSRTAQMAMIIPFIYLFYKKIYKKNNYIKFFVICLIPMLLFGFIEVVTDVILRIGDPSTDGGASRISLWKAFFDHFNETHYMIGNGIYSSYSFLMQYVPHYLVNTNMHNFIINIAMETGIIGVCIYILFLLGLFRKLMLGLRGYKGEFCIVFILPLVLIMSLQYLGYDNDIVVYLVLLFLIKKRYVQDFDIKHKL
ncbi:TPA: O-antigen ligase family protein [Bacillus paranthracis]|uniref:O-antigen ligase family protein n=2 Tax=Bacteria TaxID=2 RepID=UPI0013D874A4|nr:MULTISPECIES: O-antigen ligase family protein [Bacillus cereus group]MDA1918028.1 O-antigen ligase family protein [Bacillus cereus group sp. BcHK140]HDR7763209.1 O-antigen ligase family protein [Bacillus paranthracis]